MRALFAHDHIFQVGPDGRVMTRGKIPYPTLGRYLRHFEHVTVAGRRNDVDAESAAAMTPSFGPNVDFDFVPSISSIRGVLTERAHARDILRTAVRKADAVIARVPSEVGYLAASLAKELGRPCALEVVGCPWDASWTSGYAVGYVYSPVSALRLRRLTARSTHAIYVTERFLQGRYPCPGVTASASNVEIPAPDPEVLERRIERIETPRALWRLGMIASLSPSYKGVDTAIDALLQLRDRGLDVSLSVLGGGPARKWEAMAEDFGVSAHVRFEGQLPAGDPVLHWLDELDVYIQPSKTEGLPRALVEALSRGLPAVGSSAGGIPELLPPEFLHPPGDPAGLAIRVDRLLGDPDRMREQARRNHDKAARYAKDILDAKRDAFWSDFANFVSSRSLSTS